MKRLLKIASGSPIRDAPREPMAEGAVPLDKLGRRNWAAMGDDEFLAFSQGLIDRKSVRNKAMLQKTDNGLYLTLRNRRLLKRLRFPENRKPERKWCLMGDEGIVAFAKQYMTQKGITGKGELQEMDHGLYEALRLRKMLGRVGFVEKRTSWASMTDNELTEGAWRFIERKEIRSEGALRTEHHSLYDVLARRGLLCRFGLRKKGTGPPLISEEELLCHARKLILEKGMARLCELRRADKRLYGLLCKKKLTGRIQLGRRTRWLAMSDDELVGYATRFMEENGISGKKQLENARSILYQALRKRGLLGRIPFHKKIRDKRRWIGLSDDGLVDFARRFIAENGITGRAGLKEADKGLHETLRKRGLLERIGLGKKSRDWALMPDEQLIQHAQSFMKENGITGKRHLDEADQGLYEILRKRDLVSAVFAGIEQAKNERLESELVSGLRKAADAMQEFGGERE